MYYLGKCASLLSMIDSDFEKAVNLIQELPRGSAIDIKYEEKLIMYSLFQQG